MKEKSERTTPCIWPACTGENFVNTGGQLNIKRNFRKKQPASAAKLHKPAHALTVRLRKNPPYLKRSNKNLTY